MEQGEDGYGYYALYRMELGKLSRVYGIMDYGGIGLGGYGYG